jgi:hypothetical protein
MPTINVEMMQQLLQEFTEKEALTGEEIKLIEQQVDELEGRIILCRDRLQNLNEDKDRLAVMMSRYVGTDNPSKANPGNGGKPAKLPDNSQAAPRRSLPDSSAETVSNAPAKNSLIEDLDSSAPGESSQVEAESKPDAASGEETIKSINDALKGLFRK